MYNGEERRSDYGWHVRKEVNLSHIITTVLILMGALKFGYDMDKRVTVLEHDYERTTLRVTEIKKDLHRIEGKIDRLLEK